MRPIFRFAALTAALLLTLTFCEAATTASGVPVLEPEPAEEIAIPSSLPGLEIRSLLGLDADGDGIDDLAALSSGSFGAELSLRFGRAGAVYPHYSVHAGEDAGTQVLSPFTGAAGPFELPGEAVGLAALDVDFDGAQDVVALDAADSPVAWLKSGRTFEEIPPAARPFTDVLWNEFPGLQARLALARRGGSSQRLRLGPHSGGDLAEIAEDGTLRFFPRTLGDVFIVNSTSNLGDSYDQDGICDTENNPTLDPPVPPSGICTLRAAIEQANFDPGAQTIRFTIGGGGAQTLEVGGGPLEITGPLTLDATTQPGFADTPLIELDFGGGGAFPGLSVMAGPTLVRGFVIGGFTTEGIAIFADDVTVETCWVGTNAAGTGANSNFRGIGSSGARTVIGGAAVGAGNVISGNFAGGLSSSGLGFQAQGNRIGTNAAGDSSLGNGLGGVGLLSTGTDAEIRRNLVSGHGNVGIRLEGDDSLVLGNLVGTDAAGEDPLPNFFAGIYVIGATGGQIGGLLIDGSLNLVSGNFGDGIRVAGSTGVVVQGNLVGTDLSAMSPLGNAFNGIHVEASSFGTVIGGKAVFVTQGNLVSANGSEGWHGIFVEESSDTAIEGNLVGTDGTGTGELGNVMDGIRIQESSGSDVGALPIFGHPGTPNRVAYNGGAGIAVVDLDGGVGGQDTNDNQITFNVLKDNGGLGIDLTLGSGPLDGVTANDVGDGDFGPNGLQNFPVISSVTDVSPGVTRIEGTLSSQASQEYLIRLFSSTECDPSGFGEAEEWIGQVSVLTNGAGLATFSFDATTQVNVVTATATVILGGSEQVETSELSDCFETVGSGTGRLGNRIFDDLDDDGLQGADEPGISGVVVNLLNSAGTTVIETTVTDDAGFYSFDDLATGTYRIGVVAPSAYGPTIQDVGPNDEVDSDLGPGLLTEPLSYTAGTVDLTRDGGLSSKIFCDGFESGDFLAWSSSTGTVP